MIVLYRILKFGFQGFIRNLALSLNATFIMTLTLIILSVFFILNLVVTESTAKLESRLDMTIFIRDSAKQEEVDAFINTLKAKPEVKTVKYANKDILLKEWRDQFTEEQELRDLITKEDNPLLREIRVNANDPVQLNKIAQFANGESYKVIVDDVSYRENQNKILTFINYSKFLRKISLIMSLVFTIISLLVIFTTIRLTIFSRREEIEIMRLVGASSVLVKTPFILEGVFYGILATIFAEVLAVIGIWSIRPLEEQYLQNAGAGLLTSGSDQNFLTMYQENFWPILLAHLVIGIMIGIISSLIAVRKYLK